MASEAIRACVVSYTRDNWMNMLADMEASPVLSDAFHEVEAFFEAFFEHFPQNLPQDLIRKLMFAYLIDGLMYIYHFIGQNGAYYFDDFPQAVIGRDSVSQNDNENEDIRNIMDHDLEELPPYDTCYGLIEFIGAKLTEHVSNVGVLICEDGRQIMVDNFQHQ